MTRYTEDQRFGVWAYAILIGALIVTGIATLFAPAGVPRIVFLPMVAILVVILNVLWLKTTVSDGQLSVGLGWLVPFMWRRIPLGEIQEVRVIEYRPLRDAGGWGYRYGRFEGGYCWFYNARGCRGVFVKTATGRHILGSQQPEALETAIRDALGR